MAIGMSERVTDVEKFRGAKANRLQRGHILRRCWRLIRRLIVSSTRGRSLKRGERLLKIAESNMRKSNVGLKEPVEANPVN
jgi:hypothetical protein